jgi:hypothetical protein
MRNTKLKKLEGRKLSSIISFMNYYNVSCTQRKPQNVFL